eukprot:jgi/Chlat1/8063/Chrsp73S07537
MDVREEELQGLYQWVDEIPLSRPKRNIARDFSDGVLMAEVIAHYYPRYVELHNYSPANALSQKLYNWNTLNPSAAPSTSTRDRADAPAGVMSTPRSPKSPRRHSDPHPSHETTKALLASKDALIKELRDINEILEAKVRKLEQLVRLKELKVQTLSAKLKLHEQPPEQQLPPQQPNWSQNEGMFDVDTARGYAEANMEQLAL